MIRQRLLILLASSFLTACGAPEDDGSLGRFEVTAERTQSCGDAGLLGSASAMSYVVHLRRVGETALHWDDGSEVLMLALDPDGISFMLRRTQSFDMRLGGEAPEAPPCFIERRDELDGVLEGTEAEGFEGFAGTLHYAFAPLSGSSCADLLQGPEPIATAMPCTIGYALSAERAH
ncbi:MAG: hypothetical protein JRI68_23510 [Deltaproteobacteria bacterium]|nr:hypothetical protein [Deltaproteobacteria bacterium]